MGTRTVHVTSLWRSIGRSTVCDTRPALLRHLVICISHPRARQHPIAFWEYYRIVSSCVLQGKKHIRRVCRCLQSLDHHPIHPPIVRNLTGAA
ncbi:hypothetical protein X801_01511, partial [Opisthorchis viverrini]